MIYLLTSNILQISPEGIIDRYPNSYNHFVLPFLIGIIFILVYLFIGLIRVLYHLTGEDRIKLLKSLFNPKTAWKNIKDIFCDCLLHTKIWKRKPLPHWQNRKCKGKIQVGQQKEYAHRLRQ